ncbi:MAG: hypothetical protein ACRDV8_02605, partial [Acidimicrobiales bacterium]
ARSLGEATTVSTLLAVLDAHPAGHLPPILRAERQLVAALAAADAEREDRSCVLAVGDAVDSLREVENPYQLAQGIVDYAEVLLRAGEDGADAALAEARDIAEKLDCPPLIARAASVGAKSARVDASS